MLMAWCWGCCWSVKDKYCLGLFKKFGRSNVCKALRMWWKREIFVMVDDKMVDGKPMGRYGVGDVWIVGNF